MKREKVESIVFVAHVVLADLQITLVNQLTMAMVLGVQLADLLIIFVHLLTMAMVLDGPQLSAFHMVSVDLNLLPLECVRQVVVLDVAVALVVAV